MKIFLYIISIKAIIIFLLAMSIFYTKSNIQLNHEMSDNDFLLFKTFIIDHAVTGM